jgi:hypothetical protein
LISKGGGRVQLAELFYGIFLIAEVGNKSTERLHMGDNYKHEESSLYKLSTVKRKWWISYFEIREEMDKINFLFIRNPCIFLTYKITEYNSLYTSEKTLEIRNKNRIPNSSCFS